jgi:hypothetical protein
LCKRSIIDPSYAESKAQVSITNVARHQDWNSIQFLAIMKEYNVAPTYREGTSRTRPQPEIGVQPDSFAAQHRLNEWHRQYEV